MMKKENSVAENSPDVLLARKFLGFNGPSEQLTNFLASNPAAAARMGKYQQAMAGMAKNKVGADEGTAGTTLEDFQEMQQDLITKTMDPTQSTVSQITSDTSQDIAAGTGQISTPAPTVTAQTVGTGQQAAAPTTSPAAQTTATTVTPEVKAETAATQAQTGTVSQEAQVDAQQQTATSIANMDAAQGTATMVNAPAAREIREGELISGVADAEKAAKFNEQIQAAQATPSDQATVQGQLEGLMQQFEGGATPPWASGAMRNALAAMSARGLGASSMAKQRSLVRWVLRAARAGMQLSCTRLREPNNNSNSSSSYL